MGDDLPCARARARARPSSRGKESRQRTALRARGTLQYCPSRRRGQSHARGRDVLADVGQVTRPKPWANLFHLRHALPGEGEAEGVLRGAGAHDDRGPKSCIRWHSFHRDGPCRTWASRTLGLLPPILQCPSTAVPWGRRRSRARQGLGGPRPRPQPQQGRPSKMRSACWWWFSFRFLSFSFVGERRY